MTEKKDERLVKGLIVAIATLSMAGGVGGVAFAQSEGSAPKGDVAAPKSEGPAPKSEGPALKSEAAAPKLDGTASGAESQAPKPEAKMDGSAAVVKHSIVRLPIILLQDEKDTFQSISREKLESFVSSVQDAIDNYLNGQSTFDTKQLIIRCTLRPDGTQSFSMTSRPGFAGRLTAGLNEVLVALPVVPVKGLLNLELNFAVADNATKLGAQAHKLIRAGNSDQAVTLLAPLATEGCKNAFVLQQLGSAYIFQGDFASAEKTLKEALKLDPRDFDTWASLVSTYHSEGKVKEAEEATKKNLDCAQDEDSTDIVNINSALYSGDWSKAETILRRQCKRSGNFGAPYQVILACTLRWQGKNDEAKQLLETALQTHMDDYYSKLAEKQLALLKGDWKTAEELGRKDLTKDPRDYESLYDMGVALKGEGRIDEARKAFEAAVQPVTPKSVLQLVNLQIKELPGQSAKSAAKAGGEPAGK